MAGEALRQRLEIPKKAFVITLAGTLSISERATDVVLEAARRLSTNNHIYWIICGRGSAEGQVVQLANEIHTLRFMGWVSDLTDVFSASNALIYLMSLSSPYAAYNSPNTLYLSIAWALPMIGITAGEIGSILGPT